MVGGIYPPVFQWLMNPTLTYLNKLYSYIHRTLHSLETYVMRVMLVSWVVVLCKYTGLPTKDETFSTTQNSLKSWSWIGMSSFEQSSLIFHLLWVTLCKKVTQLEEEYGGGRASDSFSTAKLRCAIFLLKFKFFAHKTSKFINKKYKWYI